MQRILIVDDSRVILSVIQTYLVGLDAELEIAGSAEQALELFAKHGASLVISDINMPGMSGMEFAERLNALDSSVKIVLISAAKKAEGSEAARRGIVDAFVPKPIDGDTLRQTVIKLLALSRPRRQELPPASFRPELSSRERPARPVRVLVADDTEVGRRILERILRADPEFELCATAKDGQEAVALAIEQRPGLVLLDATLPKLDGLTCTRRIMQEAPTRVVILTEQFDPKSASAAFEATRAGALDLLQRPSWGDPSGPLATNFRGRLKELAEVPVIRQRPGPESPRQVRGRSPAERRPAEIVAIVASTGGPGLLASLLPRLRPAIEAAPVLVLQHLREGFDGALVSWLAEVTRMSIRLAVDGEPLVRGSVLMAPDVGQLEVASRERVSVGRESISSRHRPSGDLLLESVARVFGARGLGVILTGMGDDGVAGARSLRSRGGSLLVQSPETCAVGGMPGAAIAEGLADAVLAPDAIADEICARVANRARMA
jgi:two-component system, chemotaxis family, protein-glutamate methylesterase/glutaminase